MHRHPAYRVGLALLLASIGAPAFATTATSAAGGTEVSGGATIDAEVEIIKPGTADGKPAGLRERDGRPAATSANAEANGGGDAETGPLPRASSARWHRFLPGMFR